jgi:3-deoxy-D-manno-octulosonic-acid transferase
VRGFFAHWRPDLGVFLESELWPNLILEARAAGVPLMLANARMSPASLRRWTRWSGAGRTLMGAFASVSAADRRTSETLSALRGTDVPVLGNLKLAAPPPRLDPLARAALAEQIGARPVWLAASTHPGEDEIALAAHTRLRRQAPDALLIIAPRHPERGAAVSRLADGAPQRSLEANFADAPVYVADTLGELGTLYDLAPVSLVAGSMLPQLKGHNPIEPAKLGSAIVTGPNVESFQDVFDALFASGAAVKIDSAEGLADAVAQLWRDEAARTRQCDAARAIANQGAQAFEQTIAQILKLTPQRASAKAANASA